jgi:hypothetical protein
LEDRFERWLVTEIEYAQERIDKKKMFVGLDGDVQLWAARQTTLQDALGKYRATKLYLTLQDGSEWELESAITSRRLMLETKGEAVDVVGFGWKRTGN